MLFRTSCIWTCCQPLGVVFRAPADPRITKPVWPGEPPEIGLQKSKPDLRLWQPPGRNLEACGAPIPNTPEVASPSVSHFPTSAKERLHEHHRVHQARMRAVHRYL